jgi:hypothetical protein
MSVTANNSHNTEYRILVKVGDEELARQEAVKAAISAEEARLSAIAAGDSEQVATEKAAQTVEDAAEALASKLAAESAATASEGFASDSGEFATDSNAARLLSEAAKVIATQQATISTDKAGQSAASAAASEAAKNLSVSAKDTAISKASEANSSSITATNQAGTSTAKAVESAQSAAQSLLSRNEAAAILANTLTGGAVAGQVPFWNGPKNLIGDSSFVWDNVNKRLGVNAVSPTEGLDVNGRIRARLIDNGIGNFLTKSATGVLQERTPTETRNDIDAIGGLGLTYDNVAKRFGVNSPNSLRTLSVGGDVEVIGQTINPLVNNYSFVDIKNPVINAAIGTINLISLVKVQGTLNLNTLNQTMVGIDVDITSNATQSHIPILARVQTSVNAVVQSQISNNSNEANAGNELIVSTGTVGPNRVEISLSAKSINPFRSGGVFLSDNRNSNYWAVGTANSEYLRFFHNSNSASTGSVDPTAWIRDNRMFIGRYQPFLPLATLHIKGEGNTLSTTSFLVQNSTSQRLLTVLDNANTGINTPSPTEALDVNGRIRARLIDNATGNFLTKSATGVLQERTPTETVSDILTALPTYNAAIFQTLTHNASGVIAWT